MKFVADAMLGRLVRWLRLSGYDTEYPRDAGDQGILELARDERRVLLTRDKGLHDRAVAEGMASMYIRDNDINSQLRQMMEAGVEIRDTPACSRCPACNGEIKKVEKGEVEGDVPPGVFEKVGEFWRCRSCGKVYWEGGHWENIKKRIHGIRKDLNPI